MTHVLACALYCNPDGTTNGFGRFLADVLTFLAVVIAVGFAIRAVARGVKRGRR